MRITVPFNSLRFPPHAAQEWGLLLFRGIPRTNEEAFWPQYSTTIAGRLQQAATLTGLETLTSGMDTQVVPYASSSSSRVIDRRDPSTPRFVDDLANVNVGLDAKFIIKNSLVLDATMNPDFSQVEFDEAQTTVNQRFEVFFPEKRPFFIENASYFDTPINLLFTRRIRDPRARLTGKLGSYAVGALVADDRSPAEIVPANDPLAGSRALVGTFRVSRDVGRASSVGVIYSARASRVSSNTVAGVDGRLKLNPQWVATFQGVASSTDALAGRRVAGPAYQASLQRSGRTSTYSAQVDDRSSGVRTAAGFITRVGIRELTERCSYRFRPEGGQLTAWGPDLSADHVWDRAHSLLDWSYVPAFSAEFIRQTSLGVSHTLKRERLRPSDLPVLVRNIDFAEPDSAVFFKTSLDAETWEVSSDASPRSS